MTWRPASEYRDDLGRVLWWRAGIPGDGAPRAEVGCRLTQQVGDFTHWCHIPEAPGAEERKAVDRLLERHPTSGVDVEAAIDDESVMRGYTAALRLVPFRFRPAGSSYAVLFEARADTVDLAMKALNELLDEVMS